MPIMIMMMVAIAAVLAGCVPTRSPPPPQITVRQADAPDLEPIPVELAVACPRAAALPLQEPTAGTWERLAITNGTKANTCADRHAATVRWVNTRDARLGAAPTPEPKP
ncbi:hypothetical protein [Mongoliimonas terrestris]|uniref:hypothetical protein n=1 Tax=Mongoliimonas terrestris TaxID=1709001 RepID=UPI0009497CDA|nr:hypothetical protein [Mongoliimonas terrestris]